MKKALRLLMLAALFAAYIMLQAASAASADITGYSAEYTVISDEAVAEISLSFSSNISSFEWQVPADAEDVEVEGAGFEPQGFEDGKLLNISGTQGQAFGSVVISYTTGSVIERTSDDFFILDLSGIAAGRRSVRLLLPEKATLKYSLDSRQPSIIPKASSVTTDGKRIIVSWDDETFASADAVMVIYKSENRVNMLLVAALFAGGVLSAYYVFRKRKHAPVFKEAAAKIGAPVNTEIKGDLTKNLLEEEKKIVELLLAANDEGMWQKQLEIRSGISKVRLSRKLRSLEQKGLIEKLPYGNANKIRLKKP